MSREWPFLVVWRWSCTETRLQREKLLRRFVASAVLCGAKPQPSGPAMHTLRKRKAFQRQYHWGQDKVLLVRKKASRNIGRLPGKENTALVTVLQPLGTFLDAEGMCRPFDEVKMVLHSWRSWGRRRI